MILLTVRDGHDSEVPREESRAVRQDRGRLEILRVHRCGFLPIRLRASRMNFYSRTQA